jgi:two-component system phosphate regulon sensor histidine kinase PhoR
VRTKFLKKAAKSLDGLDVLVQDLLTLSQIETGDIKMRFENIDLNKACVSEVVDQFEEKAERKNIKLKLKAVQNKISVYADWLRITQVVTNLVSNAVSYTPEGGVVTVWFDISKKHITTFISDTGEGIPQQHLARIFERFYRVDQSRSREKGGTGSGVGHCQTYFGRPQQQSRGSEYRWKRYGV